MEATVARRRFNVHEYHRMAEAGILEHGDRSQLLDGEVVVMASVGSRHASTVARLTRLFSSLCGERIVWVQNPVRLNEWNEPEPDLCLLRPKGDLYRDAHPTPSDTLLLIEVSDASLRFDREEKLPIYAQAGIVEFWIIDLAGQAVEVYRDPGPGGYGESDRLALDDLVSPLALPNISLRVGELLP